MRCSRRRCSPGAFATTPPGLSSPASPRIPSSGSTNRSAAAARCSLLGAAHHDGWPFPEGGAGRITDALVAEARSHGVEIEPRRAVERLADLPQSRVALFDTGPRALADVAGNRLPSGYRRRLRGYRYGPAVFKLDIALDGPIPWQNEAVAQAGTVHLGGTFEEIAASEADANAGRLNPRPFVLLAQQSLFDRTRAPDGKHAIWAYCHVPHGSNADRTDAIVGQIERFAPGFRERILAIKATNGADLEAVQPEQRRRRHVGRADRHPAALHPARRPPRPLLDTRSAPLPLLVVDAAGRRRPRHVRLARGTLCVAAAGRRAEASRPPRPEAR